MGTSDNKKVLTCKQNNVMCKIRRQKKTVYTINFLFRPIWTEDKIVDIRVQAHPPHRLSDVLISGDAQVRF